MTIQQSFAANKNLAKNIYYAYRIYQHYLLNNGLDDDSNAITSTDLINFVTQQIEEDDFIDLYNFCIEAY